MECRFLACIVVYWFVHLLPGYRRIALAWGGSHLVPCFRDNGLFLCLLGLVGCSSCEVHLRSCIVGFLLNWRVCLHWDLHCSFDSLGYSCFCDTLSSRDTVGHGSLHCWMIMVWIAVRLFVPFGRLVASKCYGAILSFWLLEWRSPLDLHRSPLEVLLWCPQGWALGDLWGKDRLLQCCPSCIPLCCTTLWTLRCIYWFLGLSFQVIQGPL